jgi:hypothetical protein
MADALLNNGDDGDIFIYTGGEQEVPRDVRRANIDESVDTVLARAFQNCEQLIEVVGHDKLKKIEEDAFNNCPSLLWMSNMNGVIEIEDHAFHNCTALSDVEFDKTGNYWIWCIFPLRISEVHQHAIRQKDWKFCIRGLCGINGCEVW